MKQSEGVGEAAREHRAGGLLAGLLAVACRQKGFDHLQISVAELVPQERVNRLRGLVESETGQVAVDRLRRRVQAREDPAVGKAPGEAVQRACGALALDLAEREPRGVPELCREVSRARHAAPLDRHRRARGRRGGKREPHGVGAELDDRLERIDHVAARLGHLLPADADEPVEVHDGKRSAAREVDSRHDHPGDPEEEDVVPGDQRVGRVELPVVLGFLGPAEDREGPELRGEPGVEDVGILLQRLRAAGLARFRVGLRDRKVAVGARKGRDPMPPPELAGNTPVADVAHPLEVRLRPGRRREPDVSVFDRLDRGSGEGRDLNEPLRREVGLDDGLAPLAGSERHPVRLAPGQSVLRGETGENLLARFEAVEARVLPRLGRHLSVRADDDDRRQPVPFSRREVVDVVCGSHLHDSRAELPVHEDPVLDHRELPPDDRKDRPLPAKLRRARILRVNRERRVAEHGLRPGGRDNRSRGDPGHVVADAVESPLLLLVDDFQVRNRGPASRAPVDDVTPAVDQALPIELHEGPPHGAGEVRVEREPFPAPVERAAELSQLRLDRVLGFPLPGPHALDEFLAAELPPVDPLLRELPFHDHLGRDPGVVRAGHPEHAVSAHPHPPRQDVLDRASIGVPDVQLPGDVGGRDHHHEPRRTGRPLGLEAPLGLPEPVPPLLERRRLEGLRKLLRALFRGCWNDVF